MRSILRRLVWVAATVAVAVAGAGAAGADPGFPPTFPPSQNQLPQLPREPDLYNRLPIPTPEVDPWYRDPANIAALKPGTVVRTRVVQTRLVGLPVPVFTKQILFRSEDVHGNPIVTATTVLVPGIPWTGSPRPVLSFQEAIDSLQPSCNPSFTLQAGTMKESPLLVSYLAQGFAVNVPDFDGKYMTFTTYAEGKMVLDSIRAVKNDTTLGLRRSAFALYGFSGGGSASIRAAELRHTYAPDVTLRATAFGGTPGDLVGIAKYATVARPGLTGAGSFTMWIGLAGLAHEYPQAFDPKKLLNKAGQQILADVSKRCVISAAVTGFWRPISDYYLPGKSLDNSPEIQKVLRDNSLGKHIPDSPLLWVHGFFDEAIPQSTVLPVVNKYWSHGADLRYFTLPSAEHLVNAVVASQPGLLFTSAVLRGLSPGPRFRLDYQPLPPSFPGT